jgi:arylsulfatase A-like enzyme
LNREINGETNGTGKYRFLFRLPWYTANKDIFKQEEKLRAVTIMFDSLNRAFLEPYGSGWVKTPNFSRLARRCVTFDNFYAGSLPCMPARRELHTGRLNFLHRGWSPLEPFDESMPQTLKQNGVYSRLVTDHCHYWEDGGSTYHSRFSSFDFIRGQEGDAWAGIVKGYTPGFDVKEQDAQNRFRMTEEDAHYHVRTCKEGIRFIEENRENDDWYLQLEYFDPHEPFFVPERFKRLYSNADIPFDWPLYRPSAEQGPEHVKSFILNYAALVSMCDEYLGKVLDLFDTYDLWKDTLLMVNTDHGYLLGEHGFIGKNYMPVYDELARLPFFIWDPRYGGKGERRKELAQTIDIPATILGFFNMPQGKHIRGKDMFPVLKDHEKIHEALLFGYFGMHVNVSNGRYVYMRSAKDKQNKPLFQYTLMPMHIKKLMSKEELKQADEKLFRDFAFTDNTPVLKIPVDERYDKRRYFKYSDHADYGTLLFDLETDPKQEHPLSDISIENRMIQLMKDLMRENEAPAEQFERLGFTEEINENED